MFILNWKSKMENPSKLLRKTRKNKENHVTLKVSEKLYIILGWNNLYLMIQ